MTCEYITRRWNQCCTDHRCFLNSRTRYHKLIYVTQYIPHALFKNYQATHCHRLTIVLSLINLKKYFHWCWHGAMLVTQLFNCMLSSSSDRERMANFVFGLNRVLIGKPSHPALDSSTAAGSRQPCLIFCVRRIGQAVSPSISGDVITAAFCSVHSKYGISPTYH